MLSKNLSLGATLLARRRALRLPLDEVAERGKVSRPTVAALEGGRGQRTSLDAVAQALGLRLVGADRLAAARERRGWSVSTAAERAGLTAPTVRLLETGGGRMESLIALAAAVGVNLRLADMKASFHSPEGAGFSSASVEWYTPAPVIGGILTATGLTQFDLDPASPGAGLTHVPASRYLTVADDGLSVGWGGVGTTVFVNPPYRPGVTPAWAAKCASEAAQGARIVAVLPASVDTGWWHDSVVASGADIVFVRGRIRFEGPSGGRGGSAPNGSAIVLWGFPPEVARRLAALPPGWTRSTYTLADAEAA